MLLSAGYQTVRINRDVLPDLSDRRLTNLLQREYLIT